MDESGQDPHVVYITTVPISLNFLRGQPRFMKDRGLKASVISSPGSLLTSFGNNEAIKTHAVEMERKITPLRDLVALYRLWALLRQTRPSIVHAHTPKAGLLGMLGATLARVPVRIYNINGFPYMTATGRQHILLKRTEKIACFLAHRVFCVSHSLRKVAIADRICPESKVITLSGGSVNGVDATGVFNPQRFGVAHRSEWKQSLGIEDPAVIVGFVGRVVRDKGVAELASAWQSLQKTHPNARLVVAGPFEDRDPVDAETYRLLTSEPSVHLLGPIEDIAGFYAGCDLIVTPSWREGFPNVPLEAAAMRVPVVASRIPGCVDAVQDGVTGILVPPGNAKALESAITQYLDSSALRDQHGGLARNRVLRDFRREDIWEAIYREYVRLLQSKGLPGPTAISDDDGT